MGSSTIPVERGHHILQKTRGLRIQHCMHFAIYMSFAPQQVPTLYRLHPLRVQTQTSLCHLALKLHKSTCTIRALFDVTPAARLDAWSCKINHVDSVKS